MSCVSSSNLSHCLTWKPCRKAGGGGGGGRGFRKSLRSSSMRGINWGDGDWQEGKRGYEGLRDGGVQGVSSVKANCSPIEWNDSEELVEVRSFLCAGSWNIWVMELKSPVSVPSSVCFCIYSSWASLEQSLSSLSLSLFTSIYLSLYLSMCLCPVAHWLFPKSQPTCQGWGLWATSSDEASPSVNRRHRSKCR